MRLSARTLLFLTLLCSLGSTGCGYHAAGSATHIPTTVRTLAVPTFATHVQAYGTETRMTEAVIRELNTRTRYRITTNSKDADATLRGTILGETVAPLTYDSTTGQSSSYLITVTVQLILTAHDGRVLYRNNALTAREQYQSTQDLNGFLPEDQPAVRRLAQELARSAVSDMLESF
jgi:hypothetical protein